MVVQKPPITIQDVVDSICDNIDEYKSSYSSSGGQHLYHQETHTSIFVYGWRKHKIKLQNQKVTLKLTKKQAKKIRETFDSYLLAQAYHKVNGKTNA